MGTCHLQLGTPATKQRFVTDPGYIHLRAYTRETTKGGGGGGGGGGGNKKKKVVGQQRRSTRSLRWRAALVIWPANNNRSGRPPVRFGAAACLLSLISADRCIATRTDLSLFPTDHEEASQSAAGTVGPGTEGTPRERREESRGTKEKEVHEEGEEGGPLGTRQMRGGVEGNEGSEREV